MKSIVIFDKEKSNSKYPYVGILTLGQTDGPSLIVLFTSYREGVVISGANIGQFEGNWDEYMFERFEGSVTISN